MLDLEPYLSDDMRARLRAGVDFGAGARARVMQRVRAAAILGSRTEARGAQRAPHPRGNVRPTVLGALLAASFVAAVITAGGRGAAAGDEHATLADTIAMHFEVAAQEVMKTPAIDAARMVAVADETRRGTTLK